jgi:hypothetical protein
MPEMPTFTIALENAYLARNFNHLTLLWTTTSHFSPHHRLLSKVVKRNPHEFWKKIALFSFTEIEFFATTCCGFLQCVSLRFVGCLEMRRGRWFKAVIPSNSVFVVCSCRSQTSLYEELAIMEWTTPQHEEIDLNCEVSSYANAEL